MRVPTIESNCLWLWGCANISYKHLTTAKALSSIIFTDTRLTSSISALDHSKSWPTSSQSLLTPWVRSTPRPKKMTPIIINYKQIIKQDSAAYFKSPLKGLTQLFKKQVQRSILSANGNVYKKKNNNSVSGMVAFLLLINVTQCFIKF